MSSPCMAEGQCAKAGHQQHVICYTCLAGQRTVIILGARREKKKAASTNEREGKNGVQ